MITFGDLITGNISDSPADREAAPFLLFLTFPVVLPLSVAYYAGVGSYKLGKAVYEHNPIRFMKDRSESKKKLMELRDKGINPFIEEEKPVSKDTNDYGVSKMTDEEKTEIVSKVNEELEASKTIMPMKNLEVYLVDKSWKIIPRKGLSAPAAWFKFYFKSNVRFADVYEKVPDNTVKLVTKDEQIKKVKKLTLTNKKGQ